MLPGEDLAGLFRPPDPVEPFRQGVVLTFDTAAGTSTVDVGGLVLSNLPLLNIGDTVNLAPGNVVVLMRINGSWAILGRVVVPGSSVLNSSAVSFASIYAQGVTAHVSNVSVQVATITIPVPAWANEASVEATSTIFANNSSGAVQGFSLATEIAGSAAPVGAVVSVTNGQSQTAVNPYSRVFAVTPGGSFTVRANAGAWNGAVSQAAISGLVAFRRT